MERSRTLRAFRLAADQIYLIHSAILNFSHALFNRSENEPLIASFAGYFI